MRKGDEKKQEMLAVAERLFCVKGYDATSVQDILDVLHVSKGGFYHHFASKEALLENLFSIRAQAAVAHAQEELSLLADPMARLNTLLRCFMPLRKEERAFIGMLLPLLSRQEGRSMRLCYSETLEAAFLPLLEQEIDAGQATEVLMPVTPGTAPMVLHLLSRCWYEAAMYLLECAQKKQEHQAAVLLSILDQYRRAVEVLLDAPYGSVILADLPEWDGLSETLLRRMMLPMQG
ncbi:MAG: TetR/AcrR family transcriptional regulator [Aristaeellaceae bacterium]